MTDEQGYCGYTNYETWAVSLWIDNDELNQNILIDLVNEADDVSDLTTDIEAWIRDEMPDLGASIWTDLLNASIGEVDWAEIADAAWKEFHEEEDEEEDEPMDEDSYGDMIYHARKNGDYDGE